MIIKKIREYYSLKKQIDKIYTLLAKVTLNEQKLMENMYIMKDDIKELKTKSHPPLFTKTEYEEVNQRHMLLEAFFDNLERIAKKEKTVAN